MRVLVISHRDLIETSSRFEGALFRELARLVDVHFVDWDAAIGSTSIGRYASITQHNLSEFDVCIFHVRFSIRNDADALEWDGFHGLRLWLETDAWLSFLEKGPYFGRFQQVFRRDEFDMMISTGREVSRRLGEDGVPVHWVPKGYDDTMFFDQGLERAKVCTFGTAWPSRRALLDYLARMDLQVEDVSGPYSSLNDRLNQFSGTLVCNMMSTIPFNRPGALGRPARLINRWYPRFARISRGIEPMAKTFEVAGAGCALIIDAIDELSELGFVNGETCLTYRTFQEAAQVMRTMDDDRLREIGVKARELARARHTWSHRAQRITGIIDSALTHG